jgi:hypothetical protein
MSTAQYNLNTKTDYLNRKMFLDPAGPVTIQRFEEVKYKKIADFEATARGFFWQPEEISLTKDANDFKDASDAVKHIFTSNLLRQTAEEDFPNLAVFDQPLTASDMERAYNELCDLWGRVPELIVVDYLDLVEAGETVPDKATFLKGFGRRHDIPLLVLHQTSRTAGADGAKLTMSSGAYGGEQQATSIIGVRRKKYQIAHEINELINKLDRSHSERSQDRLEYLRHEAMIHEHTLTVSLLKNKRPAGQLVDDIDFELDAATGRLTYLDGKLPHQYQQGNLYE